MNDSLAAISAIAAASALALTVALLGACAQWRQPDPLPSWNDGPAKDAIVQFVRKTTDAGSPQFVPPPERIATFDQDGTLWVEHPMYAQVVFALDRVKDVVKAQPRTGQRAAVQDRSSRGPGGDGQARRRRSHARSSRATHAGLTVEAFQAVVKSWARDGEAPGFKRPYTELVYVPMLEVLQYLRANGYKTYIVTGGGPGVRARLRRGVYGVPPEQVIGTLLKIDYEMRDGEPTLTKRRR